MINAWSLLYDELYGDDEMTNENKITPQESDEYDPIITVGSGNTASAYASEFNIDLSGINSISLNTDETLDFGVGGMGEDCITFGAADSAPYTIPVPDFTSGIDTYGDQVDTLVDSMGDASKPQPDLKYKSHKYQEDKGIADLRDYVSSTYKGHYTNENSDTQTLDLIHSVGDAESFCRSNALKYLSRYDKKGTAKNDILKAMHYCLLLYYFSGNTKEPEYTNTRYETF
tara:strand:+ start:28 stop:714 length:687 start_codon:yes stop_codon:yes gene_type:complete